ncbi:membrane protein [Bacteroidia bacterium]|nr:membrane protein [Bacteroidia bacterium]
MSPFSVAAQEKKTIIEVKANTPIIEGFENQPNIEEKANALIQRKTLQQCIEQALEANYSIKIARSEEEIAHNNVTFTPFLPTVDAELQQNQRLNKLKTTISDVNAEGDNPADVLSAGVSLKWRLFDGLAMFTSYDKSKELHAIGELNTKMSLENLIVRVSAAYYHVIVQHNTLVAARHSLGLSQERFNEAKDKYMLGVLSGLHMQQSKIDLNADSSKYMKERELLKSAYITLNMIMNNELQDVRYVDDTIALRPPMFLDELKENMLTGNTMLQIARRKQTVSAMDVKLARATYLPSLDFSGGYNFSQTKTPEAATSFNRTHGPYWGFTLGYSIFDRMERSRKVKNARLQQEQSSWSYMDVELQTMADLAQLYNTYENNLQIVSFEAESAAVAAENLDAALEKYKLGSLSGIEFREFQRSYIDAVDRKLSAIYQAKVSELELLLISGEILK